MLFVSAKGKAHLCIEFTTVSEINACFEREIERRMNVFFEENNIDFDALRHAFHTYLVKLDFCSPDSSVGVCYVNFIRHFVEPTDKTALVQSLDTAFFQDFMSKIETFSAIVSEIDTVLRYIYLWHEVWEIVSEFSGDYPEDDVLHLIQISQFGDFFSHHFGPSWSRTFLTEECIGFLLRTYRCEKAYKIYDNPIYQFFYLVSLLQYPHTNRVLRGEAIFLWDMLCNWREVQKNVDLVLTNPELHTETVFVRFIYTPDRVLEDVVFFTVHIKGYSDTRSRHVQIFNKTDINPEILNAFFSSHFEVGIHNDQKVPYLGYRMIF